MNEVSQIITYVTTANAINWKIRLLDGTILYSPSTMYQYDECHIDLANILIPNTQFRLYASLDVASNHETDIMVYVPLSNAIYYDYKNDMEETEYINYRGIVNSPLSPPIIKCSKVSCENLGWFFTEYQLRMADGSGTIYTSGEYADQVYTWSKELSELNIETGTQLILHAGVMGGEDSELYAILEYDSNAGEVENTIYGVISKSMLALGNTRL